MNMVQFKRREMLKFYVVRELSNTPATIGAIYSSLKKRKLECGKPLLKPSETFNVIKQMIIELIREKRVVRIEHPKHVWDKQRNLVYIYVLSGDESGKKEDQVL